MKITDINLTELFENYPWDETKIHVAQQASSGRPIDVFTRSFNEWQNDWNGSWHSNHCWNRKFIFSMIEMPNKPDHWLFGGVFRVLSHGQVTDDGGKQYVDYRVEKAPHFVAYIGRLIIHWKKDARAKGRIPVSILDKMSVAEILPKVYAGEDFPGYGEINHKYSILEQIWNDFKEDWLAALKHCQGIYLITDRKTGLRYVGSAYGWDGI